MISFKACHLAFLLLRCLLGVRKHTCSRHRKEKSAKQRGDSGSWKTLVVGVLSLVLTFPVNTMKFTPHLFVRYWLHVSRHPVHTGVHMESQKRCSSYSTSLTQGSAAEDLSLQD